MPQIKNIRRFSLQNINSQVTPNYGYLYETLIMLASLLRCLYKKYAGDEGYGKFVQGLKYDKTFEIGVKRRQREKKLMEETR